ncbi:MAG: hypothetical protein ABIW84_05325 [Ilumatobacteraceae bacterium]
MTNTLSIPTMRPARSRSERPARQLRTVLAMNAATSLLAGICGLLAADWVSDTLGIGSENWTRVVGGGLFLFAIDVAIVAARARAHLRSLTLAISILDIAWVAATAIVLAAVDLTTSGRVVAVVLGLGVLDFAVLQLWFRSRCARDE